MTRRIALTVLALVTVMLLLAMVPLGLLLTDRERTAYRSAAQADARTVTSAAEEHLADHKSDAVMRQLLDRAQQRGDCAAVYDAHGQVLAHTACTTATTGPAPVAVAAALKDQQEHTVEDRGRLTVTEPIGDTEDAVGAAVLVRSLDPLDDRIAMVQEWLALIAVVGLIAGTLVSVRLARWVGAPLQAVDRVAQRLGEGALEVRAEAGSGPPEVRRLAATFNTMAARTEALVHGHRSVIADVSHQLRTPLAALRLRLDLLATDADRDGNGDAAQELAGAQEEIARLSRMVDGLLAVARAESAVPRPRPVRIDEAVAERVAAWEPVAAERQVALAARCRPGLTALLGLGDLEQVLDNLVANALDAVPAGGRVRIEAEPGPGSLGRGTVRLRVVDDGPGMTARARAAAFHRFGNPEARGTGLGLAIVHRLVTANGGTAALSDTPAGGLTVTLELPPSTGPSPDSRLG